LSNALIAIASLHVVAALKHQFWNKDDVLVRMLPKFRSENES
jgi:cytochrome b561